LIPQVKIIHQKSRSIYGKRRIAKELQPEGIPCGEHKAGTLMKLAGVQAKQKNKFKATTDSKHNLPVSPNLLKREFTVLQPNIAWVGDITLYMDKRRLVVPCCRYRPLFSPCCWLVN